MNNTLLKKDWVIEDIKEGIKKFIECNENENTSHQNLWDTAKAVSYTHLDVYKRQQCNFITLHFGVLKAFTC